MVINNFPTDYTDYYYLCNISSVEEAKYEYQKCNSYLLGESINSSPVMSVIHDDEKNRMYEKYTKLYLDYLKYSEKIIKKDGINSEVDFKKNMNLLMLIANETYGFTYANFGVHRRKLHKCKGLKEYNGKKANLYKIICENSRISNILNSEVLKFNRKNIEELILAILCILVIGVILAFMSFVPLCDMIIYNMKWSFQAIISLVLAPLALFCFVSGIVFSVWTIRDYKILSSRRIKAETYKKNKKYIIQPFKKRYTLEELTAIQNAISKTVEVAKETKGLFTGSDSD